MEILVINGSPKGRTSVTVQTAKYWEILHPEITFTYLNAGARINALEKDFSEAAQLLLRADILLFSYPVYTFLAPSQLHRFISLVKHEGIDLIGKPFAQLTTSKHFYDTTAHAYVRDNGADIGMNYLGGLSADMDDLTKEKGREEAEAFFKHMLWAYENRIYEKSFLPGSEKFVNIVPAPAEPVAKKGEGFVSIVADFGPEDESLKALIDRFRAKLPYETELVNLRTFPFKGGCLGCFGCAADGVCVYKDGYSEMLARVHEAKAIVLAFSIEDHSMGPRFKMYDDRQFCNGHRTVTEGTPFGYLVSGPLSREENLREVITARAEVGGNFLAGIAGDEHSPEQEVDALVSSLRYAVENGYRQPKNFYGVGGMKIFRDLIWLMQGLMREDHRFFKSHGQYDFPQKQRGRMLAMYLVGGLMRNKKLAKKAGGKMTEGMLAPYTKVLEAAKKKTNQG